MSYNFSNASPTGGAGGDGIHSPYPPGERNVREARSIAPGPEAIAEGGVAQVATTTEAGEDAKTRGRGA
jgi:hypothetical protein